MVTGSMSNQVGLRTHTEAGDQVLAESMAHLFLLEGGAPAALSGLTVRQIPGTHGMFTADQVASMVPVPNDHSPKTLMPPVKLLCVENTHNVAGGTVWPLEQIAAVTKVAHDRGLATHLDGARIWNASARTGIPEADYAVHFDTVSVCFSKGLGAPVGSALAGPKALIARARRFKQGFGGGFRQAGIVAAGALHAVRHHRERMVDDHTNAARLAAGLAELPGIEVDLETVQTNIVRFRVTSMSSIELVERCHAAGVYMLPSGGPGAIRAVLYLDITAEDVERALGIVTEVMGGD
jgi:threonine aldolase